MIEARVVFLTHYIPLYQVRVLQAIASQVRDLRVLVSTPIEPNRDFNPDWSGLDVTVQDTITLRRQWRHRGQGEFSDSLYIHVPYDTGRQLAALRPDAVMSLELGARSVGAARYCRRHPESKLILCTFMSERTEESRGWIRHRLRKRLVGAADALTYNGPSCKQYLRRFGVDESKLFHLPYAADDRTLYRGPLTRDEATARPRLLVVGQLSERKGVLPMLRQVADYVHRTGRELEISFAGSGVLAETLANQPVPSRLHVRLLGNVPAEQLAIEMSQSGVMIAPTLADEWMLVVNEALQAGLPVIGSVHAQAVTTLIRDGHNGWSYDPVDDDALGRALDRYFECSTPRLEQMRIQARESVRERSPGWAAEGAIAALRSVLDTERQTCSRTLAPEIGFSLEHDGAPATRDPGAETPAHARHRNRVAEPTSSQSQPAATGAQHATTNSETAAGVGTGKR
ncbi:MAG: glycosyltransferase family 4 protein [Planctomycetota bacterium]